MTQKDKLGEIEEEIKEEVKRVNKRLQTLELEHRFVEAMKERSYLDALDWVLSKIKEIKK